MKKRIMAVVVLAMTMTVSACGKAAPRTSQTEVAPMAQANTIATEKQEKKAPDLFGNPDMSKITEKGLIPSAKADKPLLSELRSVYTVINWQMYSELVSGSELTVEPIVREDRDADAPDELDLYVFAYNEDYAWNKEDAIVKITGGSCHPIVASDSSTIHTYWMQGKLPEDMPSGKYTFVFATVDGKVDAMTDVEIVRPEEAKTAPQSID